MGPHFASSRAGERPSRGPPCRSRPSRDPGEFHNLPQHSGAGAATIGYLRPATCDGAASPKMQESAMSGGRVSRRRVRNCTYLGPADARFWRGAADAGRHKGWVRPDRLPVEVTRMTPLAKRARIPPCVTSRARGRRGGRPVPAYAARSTQSQRGAYHPLSSRPSRRQ